MKFSFAIISLETFPTETYIDYKYLYITVFDFLTINVKYVTQFLDSNLNSNILSTEVMNTDVLFLIEVITQGYKITQLLITVRIEQKLLNSV